jgi:hypothetical protein
MYVILKMFAINRPLGENSPNLATLLVKTIPDVGFS